MTTIEWIEELVPFIEYHSSEANKAQRLLAIAEAIAALEVVEWANNNRGSIIKMDKGGWMTVSGADFAHTIEAPSLIELAGKLRHGDSQ